MSKAPTPAPKSTDPIGAYATQNGFAAYDATGRAWPVDADRAAQIGIRAAAPDLFPPLTGKRREKVQ